MESEEPTDPYRETDESARALGRELLATARFAALGTRHPDSGHPHVSRILIALGPDGAPVTLISQLALHTRALLAAPVCAVTVGEVGEKGDPLTHPRMTITARAAFLQRADATRDLFLKHHPKAKLYAGFADFSFVRLDPISAELNGGFGKAYRLSPDDFCT